jgi:hypothetical protein
MIESNSTYINGYDSGPSTAATPDQPISERRRAEPLPPVKIATPDILLNTDLEIPVDALSFLFFEAIAAQELIEITRNDIVNGQSVTYSPIKNLSSLAIRYNPQNLIAVQNSSKSFFNNFSIKLERYLPDVGLGPGGSTVYIDPQSRDLVVNLVNVRDDERVEIQVMTRGQVFDDTIYTDIEEEES